MTDVTQATFLEGPRPDNFMAGVINDQQQMELVVNELRSLGFPEESIAVLHGDSGADALRHRGEQPGVTGFFQGILARFKEAAGNETRKYTTTCRSGRARQLRRCCTVAKCRRGT